MSYSLYNFNTWLSEDDIYRCWLVTQDELPQSAVTEREMLEFLDLVDHVIENRTVH